MCVGFVRFGVFRGRSQDLGVDLRISDVRSRDPTVRSQDLGVDLRISGWPFGGIREMGRFETLKRGVFGPFLGPKCPIC